MTTSVDIIGSSNIKKVSYNDWFHDLVVTYLNGASYIYRNVPEQIFTDLLTIIKAGGSVGHYLYYNVRTSFEYQKV